MVDGCFMVDGPCVNHAENAANHVLRLTLFGQMVDGAMLISIFEFSGHQFGTILIEIFHTNFSIRVYLP